MDILRYLLSGNRQSLVNLLFSLDHLLAIASIFYNLTNSLMLIEYYFRRSDFEILNSIIVLIH